MKCRLFCQVEDGKIVEIKNGMGIEGNKIATVYELLYHPQRLKSPLMRTDGRGAGKWERITWDRALEIMAKRFGDIRMRYGSDAIATIYGCGHKIMAPVATFLFSQIIGTPNVMDINQQCSIPLGLAERLTFGDSICGDFGPHFKDSKCILLWGSNTRHNRPPLDRDINIAQSKGAKVIRVDPRPPETLNQEKLDIPAADIWLRLRPGTDAALALGMIKVIIDEGFYDKRFVDNFCVGFDELKRHVSNYPLNKVAEICWLEEEDVFQAARLFSTTRPSCLQARLGVGSQQANATQASRAVCILAALGSNLDVKGGNLIPDNQIGREVRQFRPYLPEEIERRRLGADKFPLISGSKADVRNFVPYGYAHNQLVIEAMASGGIKALFCPGSNLVVAEGNSRKTIDALLSLEFLVVVDLFMTPTAELADLVLPAAHFLETEVPLRAYQNMGANYMNYVMATRKVVEPAGECWDDRKIVIELGKRMGVPVPWQDVAEQNDWQVEPLGVTYQEVLRAPAQMVSWPLEYEKYKKGNFKFKTPSGKIELYSSILEQNGYPPLPRHIEPPQSPISTPELFKEYSFILTNHRTVVYTHSEFRQVPSLRSQCPDPVLEINSDRAAELGIEEDDRVVIQTPGFENTVIMVAKLIPELHPNVVSCTTHWWFPEHPGPEHGCLDSNVNAITSTDPPYDPISMNYQMRAILCSVRKA